MPMLAKWLNRKIKSKIFCNNSLLSNLGSW
jgi:hypothetical protein